jgi:hypothetical protein
MKTLALLIITGVLSISLNCAASVAEKLERDRFEQQRPVNAAIEKAIKDSEALYKEVSTPYLNLLIEFMKWAKGNVDVRSYSPVALEILERYEQLVQQTEERKERGRTGKVLCGAILPIVTEGLDMLREYVVNIEQYDTAKSRVVYKEFERIMYQPRHNFPQLIIPRKD